MACLSVCLLVCLFVSKKSQNGWTDRAKIFCGISRDPREGLWMIKFSIICLHQNLIFENFENPRNFFLIRKFFFFFTMYTKIKCSQWKWKMGAKRTNSLVPYIALLSIKQDWYWEVGDRGGDKLPIYFKIWFSVKIKYSRVYKH